MTRGLEQGSPVQGVHSQMQKLYLGVSVPGRTIQPTGEVPAASMGCLDAPSPAPSPLEILRAQPSVSPALQWPWPCLIPPGLLQYTPQHFTSALE